MGSALLQQFPFAGQSHCSATQRLSLDVVPFRTSSSRFGLPSNRSKTAVRCSMPTAHASGIMTTLSHLKGGAGSIGAFLESAHPNYYFVYLLAAGFGLPCSEDALVVWVGSRLVRGIYGPMQQAAWVLFLVYLGVVLSDLVTFLIGLGLRHGLLNPLKERLLPKNSASIARAEQTVTRWSNFIGFVQRFSLGFRGPLCLIAGFSGVSPTRFAAGACLGALGTMPIQLTVGYYMRSNPNPYLSTLALVAVPNIVGNYLGPLVLAIATALRLRQEHRQKRP